MSLESDLFQYFKPDYDLLEQYGFVKKDDSYFYRAPIKGNQLTAIVEVDEKSKVRGRIIDNDLEEEYVLFRRIDGNQFASEVREEYLEVLKQIVIHCFKARPFASEQANMIHDYVYREYGDIPDNPFKKTEDFMVIRNHNNNKWYALITTLPKSKLTGSSDEKIEIMNLKVAKENLETYLKMDNVFPSYHMNKKNWVSVILDSTVSDEMLTHMVDESYGFTNASLKPVTINDWLLPANPAYYDVMAAFHENPIIEWPSKRKMQIGDAAYVYYSAPYSAIVMKAVVIETGYNYNTLKAVEFYDKEKYPLAVLKEHGLKTVRFVNRLPFSVKEYLESK